MPSEQKLKELILLIRKTTEGDIEWVASDPPSRLITATEEVINEFYEAKFKTQKLAVLLRRFRAYDSERDDIHWTGAVFFAFMDHDRITWETNDVDLPIGTLFRAAQESAADVDGIVDSLLG